MTFEEQLRQDFADDTAYERLVVETLVGPIVPPPLYALDLRDRGAQTLMIGIYESLSAPAVEEFAERLRPLAFGAAYKILDFVIEMTIRLNAPANSSRRLTFDDKTKFAGQAVSQLPAPLDSARPSWERTAALYSSLIEHRHALVHRRATVLANGDLTGTDSHGLLLSVVSAQGQAALCAYVSSLAEALVAGTASVRKLNAMAWNLDLLSSHHGLGTLGATKPSPKTIIDDLEPGESGRWKIDGARLQASARAQNLHPLNADIELHATVDGRDVVYEGHLDEVPDEVFEFGPATPPLWLRRV